MSACRRSVGLRRLVPIDAGALELLSLRGLSLAVGVSDGGGADSQVYSAEALYGIDLSPSKPRKRSAVYDPCPRGPRPDSSNGLSGCFATSIQAGPGGTFSWTFDQQSATSYAPTVPTRPSTAFCFASDGAANLVSSDSPFAGATAWQRVPNPTAEPETGTPSFYDSAAAITHISCLSSQFCLGMTGNTLTAITISNGGVQAALDAGVLPPDSGADLVCPSSALCLSSGLRHVVASTDPSDPMPLFSQVLSVADSTENETLDGVVCADASLCIASGGTNKNDWVASASRDPATAGTWQTTNLGTLGAGPPNAITCPSENLCVGANDQYLFTSTDPSQNQWTAAELDPNVPLSADLTCPSADLCLLTDAAGRLYTSTDPSAGIQSWQSTQLEPSSSDHDNPLNVTCASTTLCLAFGPAASDPVTGSTVTNVFSSTAAGSGNCNEVQVPAPIDDLTCPDNSDCVGLDENGELISSTDPTGPGTDWQNSIFDAPPCALTGTPCDIQQLWLRDAHGIRLAQQTPAGAQHQITNIAFSANPAALTWSENGSPRILRLR